MYEAAVCVVETGRPVGTPCRDDNEVPRAGDGTGEARRAIEACLLASGAGDVDRMDEVEIGSDRGGFNEELSPLSMVSGERGRRRGGLDRLLLVLH